MSILNDGHSTTLTFAATPGIAGVTFKEKEVTPPAIQGGGENDTTTMRNTFPDGATLAFWGWLDEFTPGAAVEGEQPEADITVICSNQNDSGVETAPVLTAA